MILPERHEFGERQHHGIGKAGEAFHVEHHDLFQCRTARAAAQEFVELLFILGEHDPGAGIIDEIFDLHGGIGRVDAGGHAAGAQDAHIGEHPFRHGIGDDGSDVARLETYGIEAVSDVPGNLHPLAPTGRVPDAEFLFTNRGSVAALFRGNQKTPRDRVSDRQHCRSGHACFLPRLIRPDAGLGRSCGRNAA